ncbi:MAG: glycosyl hydrolase, partial [Fulvivirga sp.]
GENWTTYLNQPTAQFYRVTTDNHFPYRIYGAQQDNSTIRISHRASDGAIDERDWEPTAGGESAHIAVKPDNNDIVYGGSYGGYLSRVNHKTEEIRGINVWPDNPMGHGAEDFKYRFQWNFPIFFSPHNPDKLYAASNQLHVTTNGGQSWETISPDLTTNDSTKLGSSGGPITQDNTSVEYYCTIFAAAESPQQEGLIWTGSDDGLIHVTKDGGKNWENVTPSNMPQWTMINSIDIDPFNDGGVYVAGTRYKLGDYQPYVYHTKDYGKTWQKITSGIASEHFTRVVRADPKRKGLLYAGTENGMYISFDNGASWSTFQLNLPIVPITDLAIKNDNLIAATQGRSFWLIDDLTPLHQLNETIKNKELHLFKPLDSYRMEGGNYADKKYEGDNHPGGVLLHFYVKDTAGLDTLKVNIYDNQQKLIRTFSTQPNTKNKEGKLEIKPGMNIHSWDLTYNGADGFDGMILWWASLQGPTAVPGDYMAELVHEDYSQKVEFKVLKDPRITSSIADLQAQFDFQNEVIAKLSETNKAIEKIRKAKAQITDVTSKYDKEEYSELHENADKVKKALTAIEEELYQTKNRSNQDPLNFPIKLNNKLGHLNSLMGMGDFKPTDQAVEFKKEVTALIDKELSRLEAIFTKDIPAFNELVKSKNLDAVVIQE